MMRPTHIQIGLYRYPILVDNERLERENLYGQIKYAEQEIYVRDDCSPERQAAILLHEVLHGILEHAGLHQGKRIEEVVTVAAPGIVDVFRRNPDLVRFLVESGSDW